MNQYEHDGLTDEEYVAWLRKLAKDAKECGGHKLCLELEVAADRIDDLLLHNRILKRELADLRAPFTYGRQGGKALPAVDVSAVELIAGDFGWTPEEVEEFLSDDAEVEMRDEKIYAKVQELRDAIEAFMCSPQKKDDKARAWEFGNCIAYIKNHLDAILEGEVAVTIDERIYEEVAAERAKQREKGDEFDKTNSRNDWITYICRYASGAGDKLWSRQDLEFREAMVKVAALAFAAIEAHDNGYLTEAADEIPTQGGKPL